MATKEYRCYEATKNEVGGIEGCGSGWEMIEAATAEEAAKMAADELGWGRPDWDGGDVIVATDDGGDSYHLHREFRD